MNVVAACIKRFKLVGKSLTMRTPQKIRTTQRIRRQRKKIEDEVKNIPDHYLDEVYSYLSYLKFRATEDKIQTDLASQSSLAKDWLRPEEDEAWKNL